MKKAFLALALCCLVPASLQAAPSGSFPAPQGGSRFRSSPVPQAPQASQPMARTAGAEEQAVVPPGGQVQSRDLPDSSVILPSNRPQRDLPKSGEAQEAKKKVNPWEYEQVDETLLKDLQKSVDEAYIEGRMRLNPLSPDRIRELRQDSLAVDEAMRMPAPDGGASRFKAISLQPGAPIQRIRLFPGNSAMVRFVDNTGAPWPILSYVVGNAQSFSVQRAGGESEHATNILIVTPLQPFADTSLAVTLAPDVPLVVMLNSSAKNPSPDYLVTFRADAPGPNAAAAAAADGRNALASEIMLSFLDGIPPKGARRLAAGGVQAWEYEGRHYVRTDRSMIWPAYKSVVKSEGPRGMRVYELPKVSSVVLDDNGKPSRIRLLPGKDGGEWEERLKNAHRNEMEGR